MATRDRARATPIPAASSSGLSRSCTDHEALAEELFSAVRERRRREWPDANGLKPTRPRVSE